MTLLIFHLLVHNALTLLSRIYRAILMQLHAYDTFPNHRDDDNAKESNELPVCVARLPIPLLGVALFPAGGRIVRHGGY
ncbi:hypothetical protein EDB19DRAFT_1785622 [Suillus lakei]|nr:hypothetical protein EDB19DRAFT_1785622 [Suillus lakei]